MNMIYSSDVCDMYDALQEEEEYADLTEEELWNEAYEEVENNLYDEESNLDIEKTGEIFLIGTLERWNGSCSVHKPLNTKNIGKAIVKALDLFDGDNVFNVFVENDHMFLTQTGHDNPTNPSKFEFRVLKRGMFNDIDQDITGNWLMTNSESLAKDCKAVYGWT